jgi:hypothetical protein
MSIELAEKLKAKLTDKYVVVDASVPELRRFADWTGKVKTVNMNCRALVEFDGPADIGWYDIDPAYLTVVDAPRPKPEKAEAKGAKHAAAAPAAAKPAAAPAAGKSPLDMIRAQQAAKAGAAPPSDGGKEMSPLEKIRAQQAAKAAGGAAPPAAAPAPAQAPASSPSKLSPIELIRQQQAAKRAPTAAPQAAAPEPAAPAPSPAAQTPASQPAQISTTGPDGKPLSKIELIRRQGPAKR